MFSLRSPQFHQPSGHAQKTASRALQSAHQLDGSVAGLISTCSTPASRFARRLKAALVRSTWLVPLAHPAHESTTRTKTHFSGPLHTTTTELVLRCAYRYLTQRTLEKLEALWLRHPPLLGESAYKGIILASHPRIQYCQRSDKTCLTVGAHTGVSQQLGLRRSFPVYLGRKSARISRNPFVGYSPGYGHWYRLSFPHRVLKDILYRILNFICEAIV